MRHSSPLAQRDILVQFITRIISVELNLLMSGLLVKDKNAQRRFIAAAEQARPAPFQVNGFIGGNILFRFPHQTGVILRSGGKSPTGERIRHPEAECRHP